MKLDDLDDEHSKEETRKILLNIQCRIKNGENTMNVWLEAKTKICEVHMDRQDIRRILKTKTLDELKQRLKKVQTHPFFRETLLT